MTNHNISPFTPHPSPFNEKYLSQIPALQLLINLGFEYLPPERALAERKKTGNVLLEGILREQLKRLNRIKYKGREFLFSEENIQTAIQKLKNVKYDGLLKTNEAVYDLITLGIALEQSIEGDSKSFNLNYIDWRNPERNVYHVAGWRGKAKGRHYLAHPGFWEIVDHGDAGQEPGAGAGGAEPTHCACNRPNY